VPGLSRAIASLGGEAKLLRPRRDADPEAEIQPACEGLFKAIVTDNRCIRFAVIIDHRAAEGLCDESRVTQMEDAGSRRMTGCKKHAFSMSMPPDGKQSRVRDDLLRQGLRRPRVRTGRQRARRPHRQARPQERTRHAFAACIGLNHHLGRPSRAIADYTA